MLPEDKEITEVSFGFQGAHLAICHKTQGFSANKKPEPLLIKSDSHQITDEALETLEKINGEKEVRIETSMFDFLRKWMNMYWDDADALSRMLGYSGDGFEVTEFVENKIEGISLLKCKELPEVAKACEVEKLKNFIEQNNTLFDEVSSEGDSGEKDDLEKGQKPSEDKLLNNQGELMADKDQEKLEKAISDLESKLADLEKANETAKAENEALAAKVEKAEQVEQDRIEKAFINKVQTYSFITEDDREGFAKTLIAVNNKDIVDALDKAQSALAAMGESQGVDADGSDIEKSESSGVMDLILEQFGDE